MPAIEKPTTPDTAEHVVACVHAMPQAFVYAVLIVGAIGALCEHFLIANLSEKLPYTLLLVCWLVVFAVLLKKLKGDMLSEFKYGVHDIEESRLYHIISRFTHRSA